MWLRKGCSLPADVSLYRNHWTDITARRQLVPEHIINLFSVLVLILAFEN